MNIAQAIKKCATDAFDAMLPCDVMYGKIKSVEPLRVECNLMELEEELIDVCEHLRYKECRFEYGLTERTIVINEGLKEGDGVVLIRQKGGERFVIVGRMV